MINKVLRKIFINLNSKLNIQLIKDVEKYKYSLYEFSRNLKERLISELHNMKYLNILDIINYFQ